LKHCASNRHGLPGEMLLQRRAGGLPRHWPEQQSSAMLQSVPLVWQQPQVIGLRT
jgi:hypothetical protein